MCNPVAAIAVGAMVYQGIQQNEAAKKEAGVQKRNAWLASMAADDALARGEKEAAKVVMEGEALMGEQVATYAAGNIDLSSGSVVRTVADTAGLTAIDAETVRNNAQREAWGLETQQMQMESAASATRAAGRAALAGGIIGGATAAVSYASASGYFSPKPS